MKKRGLIIALSIIVIFSIMVAFYIMFKGYQQSNTNLTYGQISYVADFSDKKILAGMADNIFVGKVLSKKGTHSPSDIPETLFTVQVMQNIKGQFNEEWVVNQQGGYWEDVNKADKGLLLVNNDPLLIVGKTYLFVTKSDNLGRWHTLVTNFGDILIENKAMEKQLVSEFEYATKEQVLYNPLND